MEHHEHKMEGGEMGGKKHCGPMHWNCCLWPMFGRLAWLLSVVAVVCAWVATPRANGLWGFGSLWYFWNAVALGVIAIPGSKRHMGACRHGGSCGCGTCEVK